MTLTIDSSKAVAYRSSWFEDPTTPLNRHTCRRLFELPGGLRPDTFDSVDRSSWVTGKYRQLITLGIWESTPPAAYVFPKLCLEATDGDGNRVYTYLPNLFWRDGKISLSRGTESGRAALFARVLGTSGTIDWSVSSSSTEQPCNASRFGHGPATALPENQSFSFGLEDVDTRYYCFRATDELGNTFYSSIVMRFSFSSDAPTPPRP